MASVVVCPSCQSNLRSATPIPAGKKVKCPKCGEAFVVPPPQEQAEEILEFDDAPAASPPAYRSGRSPAARDNLAARPRPRPVPSPPLDTSPTDDLDFGEEFTPKKKKPVNNNPQVILLAGAELLQIALLIGVIYLISSLEGGGGRGSTSSEMLAFAPPDSDMLIGINVNELLSNSRFKLASDKLLQQEEAKKALGMFQSAGVKVPDDIEAILVASKWSENDSDVIVIKLTTPMDEGKLLSSFASKTEKKAGGVTFYRIKPTSNDSELSLYFASDKLVVLTPAKDGKAAAIFESHGQSPELAPELTELLDQIGSPHMWMTMRVDPKQAQENLANVNTQAGGKAVSIAKENVKAIGIWGSMSNDEIQLHLGVHVTSSSKASEAATEANSTWEKEKEKLRTNLQFFTALMSIKPDDVKAVFDSVRISSSGAIFLVEAKIPPGITELLTKKADKITSNSGTPKKFEPVTPPPSRPRPPFEKKTIEIDLNDDDDDNGTCSQILRVRRLLDQEVCRNNPAASRNNPAVSRKI